MEPPLQCLLPTRGTLWALLSSPLMRLSPWSLYGKARVLHTPAASVSTVEEASSLKAEDSAAPRSLFSLWPWGRQMDSFVPCGCLGLDQVSKQKLYWASWLQPPSWLSFDTEALLWGLTFLWIQLLLGSSLEYFVHSFFFRKPRSGGVLAVEFRHLSPILREYVSHECLLRIYS